MFLCVQLIRCSQLDQEVNTLTKQADPEMSPRDRAALRHTDVRLLRRSCLCCVCVTSTSGAHVDTPAMQNLHRAKSWEAGLCRNCDSLAGHEADDGAPEPAFTSIDLCNECIAFYETWGTTRPVNGRRAFRSFSKLGAEAANQHLFDLPSERRVTVLKGELEVSIRLVLVREIGTIRCHHRSVPTHPPAWFPSVWALRCWDRNTSLTRPVLTLFLFQATMADIEPKMSLQRKLLASTSTRAVELDKKLKEHRL